jgi:divalent metal cation (Fe/Co/Zn/Cd) transporter
LRLGTTMPDASTTMPILPAGHRDAEELRAARFAMRMSLAVGVLMLAGKSTEYFMTGSAAILSDFAESVVHVIAVAFAAFSLRLSTKPAGQTFLYGYERITFFPPDSKVP